MEDLTPTVQISIIHIYLTLTTETVHIRVSKNFFMACRETARLGLILTLLELCGNTWLQALVLGCWDYNKSRLGTHKTSFINDQVNQTSLSTFIWGLKEKNISYDVSWKYVDQAKPFSPVTGTCGLCIRSPKPLCWGPVSKALVMRCPCGSVIVFLVLVPHAY